MRYYSFYSLEHQINTMKELLEKLSLRSENQLQLNDNNFLYFNSRSHPQARKAAVCILLFKKEGHIHIGMIKRNKYPGVHSQQIGFAGGKVDDTDKNLWETARREVYEELGLNLDTSNLIGKVKDIFIPPSNFLVRPYIAYYPETLALNLDLREVDYFVDFPLNYIFEKERYDTKLIDTPDGRQLQADILNLEEDFIWGASYAMLKDFYNQFSQSMK